MIWADLPNKLKLYISSLTIIGGALSLWAIWNLASDPPPNHWIVLLLLVAITLPFNIFLESVNTAVGIGDAFTMAIGMMYGPAPCILVTFLQSFVISIFRRGQKVYPYKVVFNIASTVCGAFLYSQIYKIITHNSENPLKQDIILAAAILVVTYFFVNSILASVAIAWSHGDSIVKFWATACMPLVLDYLISASCATFLVVASTISEWISLAIAPAILAIWIWNKYHKTRIIQAQRHLDEQEQLYLRTVETLALAVDAKDQTTYGHIRRVRAYAIGMAKLCGIKDANELKGIETGALLHDIGKLAVDDHILNKPGRLSKAEFEKIKKHTTAGDEILRQVSFPFPVAKYVRSHHERWDGLGYPDGLKGEEIPLGARILSIADAFDAIRFSRPYKLSVSTDEALEILRSQSGTFYDPELVSIFTEHIHELELSAVKESADAPKLSFRDEDDQAGNTGKSTIINQRAFRDVPEGLVQIAELCSALPGYLYFNDILPIISRRLAELIPYSTCVFYLNTGNNLIRASYATGLFSGVLHNHTMEMGKGISGWVAAYKRHMMNTGPVLDFQGIEGDFSCLADALVVPIIQRDESLGAISLYAQKASSYTERELSILQTLASFLAPVISEAKKNEASESMDAIDPTTQLRRVSYLTTLGPQLISSAGESRTPISLLYFEIRNLGQLANVFGSNFGNSIVKKLAGSIQTELRETDILVRYGHQGYVAFLPGVRDDQAIRCSDRIRQQIKSEPCTPGQGFTIDLQAGVSYYPKDGSTVLALIQSAQENMRSEAAEKPAPGSNVIGFFRT